MNQMEIVTTTDLSLIPQVIEWNHEELKSELKAQLEVYKNLVVTSDAIKSAKSDRANLNKLATAVEEYRKDVKRRCLEPYNALEAKCKELVGIIKEPIDAIDTQIKAFEDKEKTDKYEALKAFFESRVGDMKDVIVFEKILDPKWANKSNKLEALKMAIEDNIDRVREELNFLETEYKDVPYKTAIIEEYMQEYNKSKALVMATTLRFRAEQLAKKKKSAEEALRADDNQAVSTMSEPVAPEQPVQQPAPVNEPVGTVSFTVMGTKSQIVALREFMKSNGIKFEVIRK